MLPRQISLLTATMLVIASMIGTGIFTTTGFMVRDLVEPSSIIFCWLLGGFLAFAGSLSYSELSCALPDNGGEYRLLSRIFHPLFGFMAGICSLVVGFAAPVAASGLALAGYLEAINPNLPGQTISFLVIILLSVVHSVKVKLGSGFQDFFTIFKLILVIGFIVMGFAFFDYSLLGTWNVPEGINKSFSPEFAISLIYIGFAYTGWNAVVYISGEVSNPKRNITLSSLLGIGTVLVIYTLINFVFLLSGPLDALSGKIEVGHIAATALFGNKAANWLSVVIGLGLISTMGAYIMTGPRVYEAMGNDFPKLKVLARRFGNSGPVYAIILQSIISIIMMTTASFDVLLTYIGVTLSIFAVMTVFGVFVLRRREPNLERPYKVFGYPFVPAVFILFTLWIVIYTMVEKPVVAIFALFTFIISAGLFYLVK